MYIHVEREERGKNKLEIKTTGHFTLNPVEARLCLTGSSNILR